MEGERQRRDGGKETKWKRQKGRETEGATEGGKNMEERQMRDRGEKWRGEMEGER